MGGKDCSCKKPAQDCSCKKPAQDCSCKKPAQDCSCKKPAQDCSSNIQGYIYSSTSCILSVDHIQVLKKNKHAQAVLDYLSNNNKFPLVKFDLIKNVITEVSCKAYLSETEMDNLLYLIDTTSDRPCFPYLSFDIVYGEKKRKLSKNISDIITRIVQNKLRIKLGKLVKDTDEKIITITLKDLLGGSISKITDDITRAIFSYNTVDTFSMDGVHSGTYGKHKKYNNVSMTASNTQYSCGIECTCKTINGGSIIGITGGITHSKCIIVDVSCNPFDRCNET